ncbi:hypothetical protein F5887DRAFT_1080869 [Amanita rubescens]|nr:hypothetical protein F5887DRAFT_1080869 [Amanita rubescens]
MDSDYDTGELDIALMEYAAARAHVKDMQEKVNVLEDLKKKRKKGYSATKWTTATVNLTAAKSAADKLKARLDALEAGEKEAKEAEKGIADASPSPPSCGGERNPMPDGADDQESEEMRLGVAEKNIGQDRSETRAPASEKNIGRDASGETRDPASEKNGQDGSETHTPASEKKKDQGNSVNQKIEGTHLDVAEAQESKETRAPEIGDQGCEAHNGSEVSAPTEPNTKKRKHDDGDEGTAAAEGHMGPGPRKIFKNKANGEEVDENKILSEVNEFIQRPLSSRLSIPTRSAIRTHQALAPTAATTSRSLALNVLTTNRRNVLCPYHQEVDKKGITDSKYLVNGVPLPRMIAETKKDANSPEHRKRLEDRFLHCGCPMDAVLWDFFFWKSLTLTATINDKEVTEPVSRWTPRDRAFILKIFEEYTFLNVNDLYTGNRSPEEHKERLALIQAQRALDLVNQYREKRGELNYVIVQDDGTGDDEDDGSLEK